VPGLTIIGLGLDSENDLSLRGLEAARRAEEIYLEDYTSLLSNLSIPRLEELVRKPIRLISREELEHPGLTNFLDEISSKSAALFVPGDPLTATTHQTVRTQALKRGFDVRVIHASSIFTAAPGLAGLFIYKFGPSATITFPDNPSKVPYETLSENKQRGLHTLFFLDLRKPENRFMRLGEALQILKESELREGRGVITGDSLFIGIARAGSEKSTVRAGSVGELLKADLGGPPHTLIAPGKLHFMEEEYLVRIRTGS
jgi:diphthine synthase